MTREEKQAALKHYKALRKAAETAARKHRDHHMVHDQLNEATIEAERDVPWWRR
jgi:pantothenate synthetase